MSRFGSIDYWFGISTFSYSYIFEKIFILYNYFLRNDSKSIDVHEFYQTFDTLHPIIKDIIPPEARILYVGCGTSSM